MSDSRILIFLSYAFIAPSFTDMQETGRATLIYTCARGLIKFCAWFVCSFLRGPTIDLQWRSSSTDDFVLLNNNIKGASFGRFLWEHTRCQHANHTNVKFVCLLVYWRRLSIFLGERAISPYTTHLSSAKTENKSPRFNVSISQVKITGVRVLKTAVGGKTGAALSVMRWSEISNMHRSSD